MNSAANRSLCWVPLWLAVTAVVVTTYFAFLTTPIDEEGVQQGSTVAVFLRASVLLPILGAVGVGLFAAAGIAGPRSLGASLRFLVGRARCAELPLAARGLWAAGTCLLHLGLCVAFIALLGMFDLLRVVQEGKDHVNPAELGELIQWALIAPLLGLFLGRFLFGACAESAALRAGLRPRSFPAAPQLVVLFVVPLIFLLITMPGPSAG